MSTVEYFEELLAKHGDSPQALDWSFSGQHERFKVLWEAGVQPQHSVLDVGCGLGHFADYLTERGHTGQYEGVDASEKLLDAARARRPDRYFSKIGLLWLNGKQELPAFDFIVSSGMLNVRPCDGHMRTLIERCFAVARVGCAINMLSARAPEQRRDRFYYAPSQVLTDALKLTSKVTLRHDYLPNDFTICLYK
jgi:cyclopropane fatty-acyl-phospholipid synthase-like methyltransferase